MSLARHGKPEIINTDQGRGSRARHSPGVLADNGVAISMDAGVLPRLLQCAPSAFEP